MSVLTSVTKSNSAVSSYQMVSSCSNVSSTQNAHEESVAETKKQKLVRLENEFLELDEKDREELIRKLFLSDIEKLMVAEKQKAIEVGTAEAKENIDNLVKKEVDRYKQEWVDKLDDLNALIEGLNGFEPELIVDQEDRLVEIILAAVLKVIEVNILDDQYLLKLLDKKVKDLVDEDVVELALSRHDKEKLDSLKDDVLPFHKFKVTVDETLTPGSYVVRLSSGALESRLEQQVNTFKETLFDTFNQGNARNA